MPVPSSLEKHIRALADDSVSGATSFAQRAASVYLQLIDPQFEVTDTDLRPALTDLTYALVRAQPTMAPLLNLGNKILQAVEKNTDADELRAQIHGIAGALINQLDTSTTRIALHALQLFAQETVVLTLSHSSAVKKCLVKAKDSGKSISVICSESRPMREGVDLARELASHNIPTTLIADAAIASMLREATIAFVGADSVSLLGLVNKIGTSGLALGARAAGIPLYALCGTEKFLPTPFVVIEHTKSEDELMPERIPHVNVRNVYFDTTPLESLTGFITEEGMYAPAAVRSILSSLESSFVLKPEVLGPPFSSLHPQ